MQSNSLKAGMAALMMVAGASLGAGPAQAADTISVVTYGGAYETSAKQAFFEPFTAKTGIGFSTESYEGGLAKLQAMEQAKNPTWDLIDIGTIDAMTACDDGLLQKIDRASLGNTDDFLPGSILPCMVASMVWSTVYAYDSSKLKTAPTTIADFFDTRKFPGKRGMRKLPKVALEWALMADGVPRDEIYKTLRTPAGVNRAFKKLDTIKSDIVWWTTGAQAPQLLADGAVVMTQAFNGRIADTVKKDHKPFKIVWDGQIYDFEWWGIPAGAKHAAAAAKFIAFASQPGPLADLSIDIPYAPPRKAAIALIPAVRLGDLPTAPANFKNALQMDAAFWVNNADDITKRFQVWLSQ
jgi:putative spermidine/putrescine transport system substrate-binding protein